MKLQMTRSNFPKVGNSFKKPLGRREDNWEKRPRSRAIGGQKRGRPFTIVDGFGGVLWRTYVMTELTGQTELGSLS